MRKLSFLIVMVMLLMGCAHNNVHESALTPGMAKKFIVPGKTSQTEVLEIFGPPDLVSRRDGFESWTYDKISQNVTSSNMYLTVLVAGYSRGSASSRNRSIMLVLYFDGNDTVSDYRLSAAQF